MEGKIFTGILLSVILISLSLFIVDAAFTASIDPSTLSQSANTTTWKVTNINETLPFNISVSPFNIAGEGTYVARFSGGAITNINSSVPRTLVLTPSIPIDFSNFKIGKTYPGTIHNSLDNTTLSINIVKSYCASGEVGNNLTISEVDIANNGEGDENTWMSLDEIELKITVDNNNNADDSERIDTIVKVGLYATNGQEKLGLDKIKFGNIKGGDDKTMTVTFEVPADLGIDESNYQLLIKAYRSGHEDEICIVYPQSVGVDREDNEDRYVILRNITLSPSPVSCGDSITLNARAVNIGTDDQDKVKVSLFNKELGLNLYQVINNLNEGEEQDVQFDFRIPQNVSAKSYNLQLSNKYDYNGDYSSDSDNAYDQSSESFNVLANVANCQASQSASITASLQTPSADVKAGNQIIIKATLRNTGASSTTYTLTLPGSEAFSTTASINPQTITLTSGQSQDILITLNLNSDASGDYTFNIVASSGTTPITAQPVSLSVAGTGASNITGSTILNSVKANWFIWVIVLINIILIVAIIIVAVKVSKA